MPFIELDRRFREPADEELEDVGPFGFVNSHDLLPGVFGWPKLLTYRRAILLAEAGSGKTEEMTQQKKKLVEAGKFALFIPLESLNSERLNECLSQEDERKFEAWKSDGQMPGWFFLDALDELKLTEGKFRRALNRLSRAIDRHLHRAHVIISCRPSDWRPEQDLPTVQDVLPVPQVHGDIFPRSSEEIFRESFERKQSVDIWQAEESMQSQSVDTARSKDDVLKVVMLPMSTEQVKRFAEVSGMNEPSAFLDEVFKQKAWSFARRPLDLIQLITAWNDSKNLGTRTELHEANVKARLKDNPDRQDRGVLADDKARRGAECLALALALTRTRTIRSPDQTLDATRANNVLEAAKILPDWTEQERQTLLRRGIFDPATYGRVRFHHRSVQEYLAACRVQTLRKQGMSTKSVFHLLFAEKYGIKVALPSMREITAWLALWDNTIRDELIEREPEALLSLGDPQTLDLATRGKLLCKFVDTYDHGSWHGLQREILEEVPRFAHPGLAPVVRKCWNKGPKNEDVRGLLLEMILEGPIKDCCDLAHIAALDLTWHENHRITAIRAMLACGLEDAARKIADDMLLKESPWPDKIVYRVAANLFCHEIITVEEVATLMELRPEPESITGGFGWAARHIVATIQPWSPSAIALRNKIADLIWREREPLRPFVPARSKFDYLAEALAQLCDRQLSEKPPRQPDSDLIRACVIASLFDSSGNGLRKSFENIRAHFKDIPNLRSRAFWTELAYIKEGIPNGNDRDDFQNIQNMQGHSLTGFLTETDRPWLEKAIADQSQPERRSIALYAWIRIGRERGQNTSGLDTIRSMLQDDPALKKILSENIAQSEQNEKGPADLDHQFAQSKRIQDNLQTQYLDQWEKWRDELLANPDDAFSGEKRENTVYWLYQWWCESDFGSKYNSWNKEAITQAFNQVIADRTEQAMRLFWRTTTPPVLWSGRPVEKRNSTPRRWLCGLWCVYAEASTHVWTDFLSPDEARIAGIYATVELNNFPSFLADLTKSHPEEINEVIGGELSNELDISDSDDLPPILHKLRNAPNSLKKLFSPRLLDVLLSKTNVFSKPKWGLHNLGLVLNILYETSSEDDREKIALKCIECYEADSLGPLAFAWLKGLFQLDIERGTQVLIQNLTQNEDQAIRKRAIGIFAHLFSDNDVNFFKITDPDRYAYILGELVQCAHTFVHLDNDQIHEGPYSPDTRDDAQRSRDFLLSKLLNTPGPEARRVALTLADKNEFADRADYIRLQIRRRTAADAEFSAYSSEDVMALEQRYEAPPRTRDGLFAIMMDRFEDLQHYFIHDDFTDRTTVKNIQEETEMQRTLAWRIRDKAKGAYRVTREEEVADQKRPDIRLWTIKKDHKAAVEIKIADKYSLNQLDKALRDQLVGQYLRPSYCKAGCLLLTYHGRKLYWQCPKTEKRLNFSEGVAWLNNKAKILEREKKDIRLAVFGLDLTDPLPEPSTR